MKHKLNVEGMSCNHCVESVMNSLSKVNSISNLSVSLENNTVEFDSDENFDVQMIKNIIEEIGFDVK